MKFAVLLLITAASCLEKPPVRFDDFKVYRVTPKTIEHLQALRQVQHLSGFNFWTDVTDVGQHVDIMVPPHLAHNYGDFVELQKLDSKLWIENVQTLIDDERRPTQILSEEFNWKTYQTLNQIHNWLNFLSNKYPGVVTKIVGGHSYEGRQILGVKISYKSGNKGIFLEGGIHAREWIAPAVVTFIADQLLTSTDPNLKSIAESYDWYIFPVVNPDGYVYTHTTNRMWRKTRRPHGSCVGADANRNWGYHWMEGGTNNDSCSETFAGSSAFSEIETKTLSEYIDTIAKDLDIYLSFHSYHQLLLIPFGHSGYEVPSNNLELHKVGKTAIEKLAKRYNTQYKVGNIPEVIYVASGSSSDWVLGTHNHIRWVYTYELRDTGKYGFLLPPEQIVPTAQETLDSVISIVEQAKAARKS